MKTKRFQINYHHHKSSSFGGSFKNLFYLSLLLLLLLFYSSWVGLSWVLIIYQEKDKLDLSFFLRGVELSSLVAGRLRLLVDNASSIFKRSQDGDVSRTKRTKWMSGMYGVPKFIWFHLSRLPTNIDRPSDVISLQPAAASSILSYIWPKKFFYSLHFNCKPRWSW